MFKKNFTLNIVTFFILNIIINIEARKRKPVEKKTTKNAFNPRDKKPARLSNELYCQICKDVVRETAKSLYNKRRDYEVIDAIEKTCDLPELYPIRKKNFFILF